MPRRRSTARRSPSTAAGPRASMRGTAAKVRAGHGLRAFRRREASIPRGRSCVHCQRPSRACASRSCLVPTRVSAARSTWWRGRSRSSHPSLVLCLGQAGGRSRMSVERVAINVDDARIADNAGSAAGRRAIRARRARRPTSHACRSRRWWRRCAKAGVPAEVSNSAGTFVCNHLIYGVLDHIAGRRWPRAPASSTCPTSRRRCWTSRTCRRWRLLPWSRARKRR